MAASSLLPGRNSGIRREPTTSFLAPIRRAYAEFLTLPTCVVFGFLLLAVAVYLLEQARFPALDALSRLLRSRMFADAKATSDLLGTIASSIITVTSITISVLLLAVQQAAGSLTHQVFDQFLRRRQNQFHFGFFVGLALYTLVTLATVGESFNPVLGAYIALFLTIVALLLLLLLFYSTIDQIRPVEIIDAIHDLTLIGRRRQMDLLRKTRRLPRDQGMAGVPVKTIQHGFITGIDVDTMAKAIAKKDVEIVLEVSIGSWVGFSDILARIKAPSAEDADAIAKVVCNAIHIERQRDIDCDPANGIEELEIIAWTSISTAKSDPDPGVLTIRALRDIMARWLEPEEMNATAEPFAIVYTDNVWPCLMDTFESLAVVASESMQHQSSAEIMQTFALMFQRLPPDQQQRAEELILRSLSALGEHVLTGQLDAALANLVNALTAAGSHKTAAAVKTAQGRLALSVGELNSRSTRTEYPKL